MTEHIHVTQARPFPYGWTKPDWIKLQEAHANFPHKETEAKIPCLCGANIRLAEAYKCLYCREWYCHKCAEIHFGQTEQEWNQRNELRKQLIRALRVRLTATHLLSLFKEEPIIPEIPEMTDKLGKYWEQPSREWILIDDEIALMDIASFRALHDYSCSIPSGVYAGKMWRLDTAAYDDNNKEKADRHRLRWFDNVPNQPGVFDLKERVIVII